MRDTGGGDERARVAARVLALLRGTEPPAESGRADGNPSPSVRLDPGRRGALALGLVALVAAVVTCWWVFAEQPKAMPIGASGPGAGPSSSVSSADGRSPTPAAGPGSVPATSGSASSGGAFVVVDVVGKVRRPGVYRLSADARVQDAIAAAGGVRRGFDTDALNLAARVVDGQQVAVGVTAASPAASGATAPGGTSGGGGASELSGPVLLNSADLAQLETLPGVGPVLAQHILDYRTLHGSFHSVDQLQDVSGIGPAKFAAMRDQVAI